MHQGDEAGRPTKKRKLQKEARSVVQLGRNSFNLDGYLNPAKKPVVKAQAKKEDAAPSGEKDLTVDSQPSSKEKPGISFTSASRKSQDSPLLQKRQALPLWSYQNEIRQRLCQDDILILVGETGSGKSTQVPQFILDERWCQKRSVRIKTADGRQEEGNVGGMIAITQPRRVAATTLAHRVAREVGTPLERASLADDDAKRGSQKGLVGYSVRFDHMIPRGTKIKFLTEGMLLQELLRDPGLRQYSAVIVDEIHERSVDVDLLSGFLKQILSGDKASRGGVPLKVIIMSATADVEAIQAFFRVGSSQDTGNAGLRSSLLKIEGRQFPVEVIHTPKSIPDIQDALLKTIVKIHMEEPLPGDILAFLTGQEEIEAVQQLVEEFGTTLASNVPKIRALPLFGQLSIEAQHEAFKPIKGSFTRKVVLATNIAETSVTVPGVRYVIDCGKAKIKQFRSRLGMESLLAKPISKSSAIQRTGRAGREAPGKCFRLYTEETYDSLQDTDLPEILRIDILGAVLTMKVRGIRDVASFPLMDAPDTESTNKALLHLLLLGALDEYGNITDMGRKMALFPVPVPFARVLFAASDPKYDCLLEAIDVIACITSGDDIFHQIQSEEAREEVEDLRKELYRREGDLLTYLNAMQHYAAENADRTEWCKRRKINIRNMRQALNIRRQLRGLCLKEKMIAEAPPQDPQPVIPLSPERAEKLIRSFMEGFALRTAILAPDGSYVTPQSKHVVAIHPSSVLHGQKKEAIMFLEHVFTQKSYAKKVSAIQAHWVAEILGGS